MNGAQKRKYNKNQTRNKGKKIMNKLKRTKTKEKSVLIRLKNTKIRNSFGSIK